MRLLFSLPHNCYGKRFVSQSGPVVAPIPPRADTVLVVKKSRKLGKATGEMTTTLVADVEQSLDCVGGRRLSEVIYGFGWDDLPLSVSEVMLVSSRLIRRNFDGCDSRVIFGTSIFKILNILAKSGEVNI